MDSHICVSDFKARPTTRGHASSRRRFESTTEVATRPSTDQVRIVRRWTNADSLGSSTEEIAHMMR